jgi:hypothetical protein
MFKDIQNAGINATLPKRLPCAGRLQGETTQRLHLMNAVRTLRVRSMNSLGKSDRDALDKLSDRINELFDLYARMAVHVGFVNEPIRRTELTDESPRKNVVFHIKLRDIKTLKERAHEESQKAGRRVTQQSLIDAALKAFLYK